MKIYVGITDGEWFETLKERDCHDVNFWKPGGRTNFKALDEGDIFLFKLHSPQNYIVGGGFFSKFSIRPSSLAWEEFGIGNGVENAEELKEKIYKYKKTNLFIDPDPMIGCIVLTKPFYFDEKDWIPVPMDWASGIVQGKLYDTKNINGMELYKNVMDKIKLQLG